MKTYSKAELEGFKDGVRIYGLNYAEEVFDLSAFCIELLDRIEQATTVLTPGLINGRHWIEGDPVDALAILKGVPHEHA